MNLTGKLIIAMPDMGDPRFERAVILICAHSASGAMGLILNQPVPELRFQDLLAQLNIPRGDQARDIRLLIGGPVERGRGFVLHSTDYQSGKATTAVGDVYGMTTTLDVLEALGHGRGPLQAVMAFGYSGWGEGQLEAEIARNDWLIGEASDRLIFGAEEARKWALALAGMGVDPMALSPSGGRA
jgi:putative transcriptional regulator